MWCRELYLTSGPPSAPPSCVPAPGTSDQWAKWTWSRGLWCCVSARLDCSLCEKKLNSAENKWTAGVKEPWHTYWAVSPRHTLFIQHPLKEKEWRIVALISHIGVETKKNRNVIKLSSAAQHDCFSNCLTLSRLTSITKSSAVCDVDHHTWSFVMLRANKNSTKSLIYVVWELPFKITVNWTVSKDLSPENHSCVPMTSSVNLRRRIWC